MKPVQALIALVESLGAFTPRLQTLARVLRLLAPVVEDVLGWFEGDNPEPPYLAELPLELQSERALINARARLAKQNTETPKP